MIESKSKLYAPLPRAVEEVKNALSVSVSTKRYQALINLAYQAGIKLPASLLSYIDDPKRYGDADTRFKEIENLIPSLVEYYRDEALAADRIRIISHYKLDPNSKIFQEIDANLIVLYGENQSEQAYQNAINNLKVIIVREKLRKYFGDEVANDHDIIVSRLNYIGSVPDNKIMLCRYNEKKE